MYKGTIARLALLFLFCIALSAWTTRKSSSTSHAFGSEDTDNRAMIGVGTEIPGGYTFISLASAGASGSSESLFIFSEDLSNADDIDTLLFPSGGTYEGNFPRGIDSLHAHNITGTITIEVSN